MNNLREELKNKYQTKKILVVGLGIQGSGLGVTKFFADLGARVTVTDAKTAEQLSQSIEKLKDYNIKYVLGHHDVSDFVTADLIIKGPGVPWTRPEIIAAKEKHIPIEMEGSLFASLCPAPIVGITGTRGKSTTTHLIYEVIKKAGHTVHLAGNIPNVSTISMIYDIKPDDIVVLELSSWQLSGFHKHKISPHIAVFTNFYPDHLNYYKTMDDYLFDKKAIYLYQQENDFLIANKSLQETIENDKVRSNVLYFDDSQFPYDLSLQGTHNKENAAAALKVAEVLKLDREESIQTICAYKGLPYRQEVIGEKDGIIFINDTTSTTPVAAVSAIKTFRDKPIIHILGGNAKGLPTEELLSELIHVDKIVLLKGTFTDEIMSELRSKYNDKISSVYESLDDAVTEAYRLAKDQPRGAYILFSPAATSFAMFKNEFDRGDHFTAMARRILNG